MNGGKRLKGVRGARDVRWYKHMTARLVNVVETGAKECECKNFNTEDGRTEGEGGDEAGE
jgi:hypothetical protein